MTATADEGTGVRPVMSKSKGVFGAEVCRVFHSLDVHIIERMIIVRHERTWWSILLSFSPFKGAAQKAVQSTTHVRGADKRLKAM